jgi:hypothetical protein
MKSGR